MWHMVRFLRCVVSLLDFVILNWFECHDSPPPLWGMGAWKLVKICNLFLGLLNRSRHGRPHDMWLIERNAKV